ncbi:MAG: type VI secretion system baseplate subunit TssF [Gammaproteobacteria bacterium]
MSPTRWRRGVADDPRLLRYYNRELQHLREMGAEFAQEFPKIAGRLGMDGMEVADLYVERPSKRSRSRRRPRPAQG